ncbi:MAG TPA: MFS transporter [Thermoleophilaceae bacterium]|nr:MFS transporter [Thermoleophilaceae bacterium]
MKNRTTIGLLACAQFVMVLDSTVMNVSISQVVDDLDTTVPMVQLAITAYTLVMAAFMLTGAKFGDIWGRRRAFGIGLAVYACGSLTTALSPNITVLLIGWSGIEGLGAVLVIPAIAALTAANYQGKERALAFALLGGVSGAGAAAGPLIGGFVTSALTWRVVFAGEVLIVLYVLLRLNRIADSHEKADVKLDRTGTVLSALGMALTVFGILKISTWGLFRPIGALEIAGREITPFGLSAVPFVIAAGIGVLLWFAHWEQRVEARGGAPLLRTDLLRIPQMRAGLSTVLSQYLILAGTFFVLPLYLQLVLGKDALQTGVKILPISVAMMITATLGPRLATRLSPRKVVQIGMGLLFVSIAGVMASIEPSLTSPWFGISLAGFGAGLGLTISQLGNIVMSSVTETRSSEAGGVQGVAQNLGQSLGTALIGAVLLASLTTGFQNQVQASPTIPADVKSQIAKGTEQGLAMVSQQDAEKIVAESGVSKTTGDEILDLYSNEQILALKKALLVASFLVFVGAWFARRLPNEPLGEALTEVAGPPGVWAPPDDTGAPVGDDLAPA